jgi:undecaprenyl-diphosphatase
VTYLETTVLAVVQGLTEFLPLSSSAHLVLVPSLLQWEPHEIVFDTTLHLGTLAAVVGYFRSDVVRLVKGWALTLRHPNQRANPDGRVAWWIIVGTIPAAVIGYWYEDFFEALFTQPHWVAFFLLITAALLISCEKMGQRHKDLNAIGFMTALGIGFAQAAAIAPGLSRSGATIAAAMLFGLTREASARYSFLLSMPIILGAGGLQLLKLLERDVPLASLTPHLVGFVLAAITGYFCIHVFLSYLRTNTLYPFACYCALVGVMVLLSLFLHL